MCGLLYSCADKTGTGDERLDLSGIWGFRLDQEDRGEGERWWMDAFPQTIRLPGSLQEQGFGFDLEADLEYTARSPSLALWRNSPVFAPYRDSGEVQLSWALTPPKYYVGPAWYRKQVVIPGPWKGRQLRLLLERVHWVSDLWIDGRHIGQENSLCVPHAFDLDSLTPGPHEFIMRIDNRMHAAVGPNAHSITDQTQTNWNGIIGRMELEALPAVEVYRMDIYPDILAREVLVKVYLAGHEVPSGEGTLRILALGEYRNRHRPPARDYPVSWTGSEGLAEVVYPLGEMAARWDEFLPHVYRLEATLFLDDQLVDRSSETFGMRQISVEDKQFKINDKRVFIRGTLENAQYPETGYPPMDVAAWRREIQAAQSFGLNHFRFHSWCPPEAAFSAADEMGFYFQVEGPAWPERVDRGSPTAAFLYLESDRILTAYGDHPSFIMFACGNEFGGSSGRLSYFPDSLLWYQPSPPTQVQQCLGAAFLGPWVDHFKGISGGRQLFTSAAGWPYIEQNDYHIMHEPYRMHYVFDRVAPNTRIDYGNLVETHDVPLVSHETGQWCVYPDLAASRYYTGYLKAANLEIWGDFARASGVYRYAEKYHESSGQFQVRLYKQEIETLLRTAGAGGFNLLGLNDYHGHGFAPVGVMDAFWKEKSYASPAAFRRFCSPVVPLARMDKRVWGNNETFTASIEIAQFKGDDLSNIPVQWEIRDGSGNLFDRGSFNRPIWPHGELVEVGTVFLDLGKVEVASRLVLSVSLRATPWQNDWEFWVYPAAVDTEEAGDILISHDLDSVTLDAIASGRRILFIPDKEKVRAVNPGNFEPIFWSTWSGTGTLGIHCQHKHAALKGFPTESHANWQWWELLRTSLPLDLTRVEELGEPIVQVIDNWIRAHELGILFEFGIGASRIMVCAMDIENNLEERRVACQLRQSLLRYMESEGFAPVDQLKLSDFREMLGGEIRGLAALGATARGSQDFPPHLACHIIDGDPETYWEAGVVPAPRFDVVVELPAYVKAGGLRMIPFRPGPDLPVAAYRVFLSHDGADWGEPVFQGLFPPVEADSETIKFRRSRNVRFLMVRFSGNEQFPVPYVALAELELITDENK